MGPPPAIQTDSLTKEYSGVTAVNGIDLTVEPGEVYGFLGPNGAGKSTTIDLLLGFLTPTSGRAHVLGTDIRADARVLRRNIGVLPENYAVYGGLTGREHLESMLRLKGVDDDPDRILDTVGLGSADRDRPASEYSKGMRQRLVLGVALAGDPELLILDEPSSGLDPAGVARVRELVRDYAAAGTTVFFSSHHLAEVEAVCDRVGIMNDGQLVAVDSIDQLRNRTAGSERLRMVVDESPESAVLDQLREIDTVHTVATENDNVVVTYTEPPAKARVIERLNGACSIRDFEVETTSLEELFEVYTHPESDEEQTTTVVASESGGDHS